MKQRSDFVSNSSSSSFIVCGKSGCSKVTTTFPGSSCYKISKLISDYKNKAKQVDDLIKSCCDKYQLDENTPLSYPHLCGDFIAQLIIAKKSLDDLIEQYEGLINKYGNDVYITSDINRDVAYERHFNEPVFIGEL